MKPSIMQIKPLLNPINCQLILIVCDIVDSFCTRQTQHFLHLISIFPHSIIDYLFTLCFSTLQPASQQIPSRWHYTNNLTIDFLPDFQHSLNINIKNWYLIFLQYAIQMRLACSIPISMHELMLQHIWNFSIKIFLRDEEIIYSMFLFWSNWTSCETEYQLEQSWMSIFQRFNNGAFSDTRCSYNDQ